jgi:SAM-dependent methyltransferase
MDVATEQHTYAFANEHALQAERLSLLAGLFDEQTTARLRATGVGPGWRCLEVGAGGGSVAAWLCEHLGDDGFVLATDLDTSVLRSLGYPNLEVRAHDVLSDELPEAEFDLVHARLLLAWLSSPQTGLRRMVDALKPGGWLVAEEMDFVSVVPDPGLPARDQRSFERVIAAHNAVLGDQHAFDPFCGRRLVGLLSEVGLTEVGCEGRVWLWRGGDRGGRVWQLTLVQLRDKLIASGLVDAAEVDAVIELCASPNLTFMSQVLVGAWGRAATDPRR